MNTTSESLRFFADFVSSQLGIVYAEANFYQLETRLKDLAKQLGFADIEQMWREAQRGMSPQMKNLLLDLATNNETFFFRDPPLFAAVEKLITESDYATRQAPLRIWSAACSYGQEVYSLAMLFERLSSKLPKAGYEMLATDVSDRALQHAKTGQYSELQVQRGLDPQQREQNFRAVTAANGEAIWTVRDELKRSLRFQKLNLLNSFDKLGTFDLIFCRNVLIYQATASKSQIIQRLHKCLEAGGYLVLGASESLIGLSDDFVTVKAERATLYQKPRPLAKAE